MQNPDLFEGDIVLTPDQGEAIIETLKQELKKLNSGVEKITGDLESEDKTASKREKRSLKIALLFEWDFPIKYYVSSDLAPVTRALIDSSRAEIEAKTCIRYSKQSVPISGTPGINVVYKNGCFSPIGRVKFDQPQELSIGEGCQTRGTIQHEQSRPDRDDSLFMYSQNIMPGMEGQFTNVMLYDSYSFSKNGQKVFESIDVTYRESPGQNERLSFSDYKIVTYNYCNSTCPYKISCYNGGYQNPNICTQCVCPNGFIGALCTDIINNHVGCGHAVLQANVYPQPLTRSGDINCFYLILAPIGFRIKIVVNSYVLPSAYPCPIGTGLEIRATLNMDNSGSAWCGTSTYVRETYSFTNQVLIHFPGTHPSHSFSLTYLAYT
uniref:ZnMc domain-containing protein n=1 Tax=Rhabditophanes sp. KR3021 TaxID=114890 RepID=A0AC35UDK6_9BILA